MGVDLGTKTIGLALSDPARRYASAYRTLKRVRFAQDAQALFEVVEAYRVSALVVGLPLNMDGSAGPRVQATRAFVRNLHQIRALPVVFQDERLSSFEAEQAMLQADVSRKKRAEWIDAHAARVILQAALDRLNAPDFNC